MPFLTLVANRHFIVQKASCPLFLRAILSKSCDGSLKPKGGLSNIPNARERKKKVSERASTLEQRNRVSFSHMNSDNDKENINKRGAENPEPIVFHKFNFMKTSYYFSFFIKLFLTG